MTKDINQEKVNEAFEKARLKAAADVEYNEEVKKAEKRARKKEEEENPPKKYEEDKNPFNIMIPNKDDLAEAFYKKNAYFYDVKTGLFWLWNKKKYCYETKNEKELLLIMKRISVMHQVQVSGNNFWNETIRALQLIGLENIPKKTEKTWLQFHNKIIDYKTKEEFEATPEYFNTNPIPHKLGTDKETPIIDEIITEWVGEKHLITLKEIISFCMLQSYPLHRMFIMIGSGLNGKGQYQKLMKKIIGESNICSSELESLMFNRFETAKLYKKLVCQIGETNFGLLKSTGKLKRLTGEDLLGFEFKNKNPFDEENYAKLIINTNTLPATTDKTIGWYRRICIIDFPNQFGEGVPVLERIPREEYENFCSQSINHIRNVLERGGFSNEGDIPERRRRYEEKSNPLPGFLNEQYIKDFNEKIPYHELYENYCSYLQQRGFRIVSRRELTNLLKNEGYETKKENVKNEGDWAGQKWVFVYGLKNANSTNSTNSTNVLYSSLHGSFNRTSVLSGLIGTIPKKRGDENLNEYTNNVNQDIKIAIEDFGENEVKNPEKPQKNIVPQEMRVATLDFLWSLDLGKGVTFSELLEALKIDKNLLVSELEKLKNEGVVFEPRNGVFKLL